MMSLFELVSKHSLIVVHDLETLKHKVLKQVYFLKVKEIKISVPIVLLNRRDACCIINFRLPNNGQ